ncbi:hypothetical protein A6S26_04220 [Nostoc sp. ATCC 43529]|nr:hypothetical protein A6S26_04220 [Nostoc sp. ATCC 43529]
MEIYALNRQLLLKPNHGYFTPKVNSRNSQEKFRAGDWELGTRDWGLEIEKMALLISCMKTIVDDIKIL